MSDLYNPQTHDFTNSHSHTTCDLCGSPENLHKPLDLYQLIKEHRLGMGSRHAVKCLTSDNQECICGWSLFLTLLDDCLEKETHKNHECCVCEII